jgi:hypothetical protein
MGKNPRRDSIRIKLELERDEFKFATTTWEGGSIRWLVVNIDGKPFAVRREMVNYEFYRDSKGWSEAVDRLLIDQMEIMIANILKDKAHAIPDGTQLLDRQI